MPSSADIQCADAWWWRALTAKERMTIAQTTGRKTAIDAWLYAVNDPIGFNAAIAPTGVWVPSAKV